MRAYYVYKRSKGVWAPESCRQSLAAAKHFYRGVMGLEYASLDLIKARDRETLPSRFHRIRYRGFLHARGKPKLQWLQLLLDARIPKPEEPSAPTHGGYLCPRCGNTSARRA